jgi:hypothetical protein
VRLKERQYTGGGLEIWVALLGVTIALIALFPLIEAETINYAFITIHMQGLMSDLLGPLMFLAFIAAIWFFLNLRGLRGEGLHILLLVAQACILAQQPVSNEPARQSKENVSQKLQKWYSDLIVFSRHLEQQLLPVIQDWLAKTTPETATLAASESQGPISQVEQILELADNSGTGKEVRKFIQAAQKLGLHVQPAARWLAFLPRPAYRFALFSIRVQPGTDGKLSLLLSPEIFAAYYQVDEAIVISCLGPKGRKEMTPTDVDTFLAGLDDLLSQIEMNSEPQTSKPV